MKTSASKKTLAKVLAITLNHFGIPADMLTADTTLGGEDIGLDGFDLADLLLSIEEEFHVEGLDDLLEYDPDDIGDLSVRKLADAVEQKLRKA